ncbi:C40 family peptidase [Natronincola ferrireducens]|uniref:NlpC/P60 family protein n=1 Tax=Natronincola ferrireducens TaxID=393762 RepID=A0A1G9FT20_9FIRM|nr:NlpC/P60 family protein [Natronincola ferrireducens]SDK91559.1 NlpC/P60 family protein [Natronincola ferrireducens]
MLENDYEYKIQQLIHKYIDLPFLHNGRSLEEGVDCLGLVILFLKEFEIHIPHNDGTTVTKDWYKTDPERLIKGIKSLEGISIGINELQPLDLIYFAINRNIITHIGIMINNKEFLHTRPIVGVSIHSLEGSWRRRFRGGLRLS